MFAVLRTSISTGERLQWNEVNELPDFVFFNHSAHIAHGVPCTACHGRVATMPMTERAAPLQMRWCLACHRQPQAHLVVPTEVFDMLASSSFWQDGGAARLPVPGTQISARGGFAASSSGRVGHALAQRWDRDRYATTNPYPLTAALLQRGQQRFDIYCAPCHGPLGDGDGYIVRRGFPAPPSYHIPRLRNASDRYFVDVMTNGYGLMYSYADRVGPADRWAIVAYIRALQLSQHVPAALLSASERARLDSNHPAGAQP